MSGPTSGLHGRLQNIDGVTGIELELGEEGLEGITIKMAEGADEVVVLDSVRRLLVAYGRGPRGSIDPALVSAGPMVLGASPAQPAFGLAGGSGAPVDPGQPGNGGGGSGDDSQPFRLDVFPTGDDSTTVVELWRADRLVRRQVPTSPRAIVQAVIDAATEATGREPISVIGLNLSSIDDTRVLTVVVANHGTSPRVATAVVDGPWTETLVEVVGQLLG